VHVVDVDDRRAQLRQREEFGLGRPVKSMRRKSGICGILQAHATRAAWSSRAHDTDDEFDGAGAEPAVAKPAAAQQ
jgi:hypothetical protein